MDKTHLSLSLSIADANDALAIYIIFSQLISTAATSEAPASTETIA